MSDKEPRRRKKRKDVQRKVHFSDDVRAEEQIFQPTKSEPRDSDQEQEEEFVIPTHQPSKFAKLVFMLLFSGLVISMSFIFISLQGTDRGPVDIFDVSHGEEHKEVSHDVHEETESWSPSESFKESLGEILPGIGNILSLNDEQIKETEDVLLENVDLDSSENLELKETLEDLKTDVPSPEFTEEPESTTDQGIIEKYIEDIEESVLDVPTEGVTPFDLFTESIIESPITEEEEEHVSESISYTSQSSAFTEPSEAAQEIDYISTVQETEHVSTTPKTEYVSTTQESEPISTTQRTEYVSTFLPENDDESEYISTNVPYTEDSISTFTPVPEDELQSPTEQSVFPEELEEDDDDGYALYGKADITNRADYEIRDQLDDIEKIVEKSPDKVLKKCEELLNLYPESPRVHYMKAKALDNLAEIQRSNKLLEEAISSYQKVMSLKDVPETLYLLVGKHAADRLRFRGFMGKSLKLMIEMSDKFPQNVDLKNQVAVGYLLIGQNKEAKKAFLEVLKITPNSGFAKVHLGFILKTDESNYSEAIKLMSEGISSREDGVIDGRFYFHLGDALHRTGRQDEALKVYEDAVKEGLFMSVYQRSLYNVKSLTGKPWWDPQKTHYSADFKLLEQNWKVIRDEALSLVDEKYSGFLPESEGLQDKGDWKQFELFARGKKIEKNCLKSPKTCALISKMPDAASCKRGQAKFSIMYPNTHVWAHTGPTNCRIRSHLGLVVPEGASIRVAEETRKWEEGKVIVFDDSFEHEVWHNGNSSRIILIVDFWHPELTDQQKRSLTPI